MTAPAAAPPPSHLMEFILGLLAPLLMGGNITDMHLARLAAAEAIAAHDAAGQRQLMTIGQILAFALTALDNLRLSMAPDLSLSMKLRLRGGANALNRSARDNTKILEKARHPKPSLEPGVAGRNPALAEIAANRPADTPPASQEDAADPATSARAVVEQRNRHHWASAMRTQAARLQATAGDQQTNKLWIDALTGVANDLTLGKSPVVRPGLSKSDLMRSTLLASGSGFPAHLLKPIKR